MYDTTIEKVCFSGFLTSGLFNIHKIVPHRLSGMAQGSWLKLKAHGSSSRLMAQAQANTICVPLGSSFKRSHQWDKLKAQGSSSLWPERFVETYKMQPNRIETVHTYTWGACFHTSKCTLSTTSDNFYNKWVRMDLFTRIPITGSHMISHGLV